jgi:sugar phosphate isomerase/epimerase
MTPLCGIGDEAGSSLAEQIAAHQDLGWSRIELRSIDGVPLAELDAGAFAEARLRIRDAGLTVTVLDSRVGGWDRPVTAPFAADLDELHVLAERAHVLGTRFLRIMSYPNDGLPQATWRNLALSRLAALAERAAAHDVVLLHENCCGWAAETAERTREMLVEIQSPALGLLFDTGNGIAYGYDSLAFVRAVVPWVRHVHVKDGVPGPIFTMPGDGYARVRECLDLLLDAGYSGVFSIEPHTHLMPHQRGFSGGSRGAFVQYGRRLESLLAGRLMTAGAADDLP